MRHGEVVLDQHRCLAFQHSDCSRRLLDPHLGIHHQSPGDGYPLLLPAGQGAAALTHQSVISLLKHTAQSAGPMENLQIVFINDATGAVAVPLTHLRQRHDEIVGVGSARRRTDRLHGRVGRAVPDRVGDRSLEQRRLLRHDRDLAAQPRGVQR